MTTIAALSFNGQACIGSNTGYTLAQDSVMDVGAPPWILFQDWALGFTGSMLALNVCRNSLASLTSTLATEADVVTEIGKILTEYDIGTKIPGEPTWSYGIWCILVHNSGKIWDIDESLCLGPIPSNRLWARGSGEKYALGAAHAMMNFQQNMTCEDIVRLSVASAIFNDIFSPGVAYTYQIRAR